MQGCCAKKPENEPAGCCSVFVSRSIVIGFIFLAFIGGCMMMSTAKPFKTDLQTLSNTLVAQVCF